MHQKIEQRQVIKDLSQESTVELQLQSVRTSNFCVYNASKYRQLGDSISKNHPTKKKTSQLHKVNFIYQKHRPWLPVVSALRVLPWFGRGDPPALCAILRPVIQPKWPDSGGKIPEFWEFQKCSPNVILVINWWQEGREKCKNVKVSALRLHPKHMAWEPQHIHGGEKICETQSIFWVLAKEQISTTNSSLEFPCGLRKLYKIIMPQTTFINECFQEAKTFFALQQSICILECFLRIELSHVGLTSSCCINTELR